MCAVTRRSKFGIAFALSFLGVLALGTRGVSAQTAVTTCGQEIRGDAYLVADLDCPPETEVDVVIENGHLDLAGFTIRGGEYGVICGRDTHETLNGEEVYDYGKCSIGNGTIADQTALGVDARQMVLTDVTIAPAAGAITGIVVFKRQIFSNLSLELPATVASAILGAPPNPRVEGSNLTITGGGNGIVFANKVKISGMTATGYVHIGVSAKTVDLENATVTGGENGVQGVNTRIAGSTIAGNSQNGIWTTRLKIAASDVTGNTLDLHLERRPKIDATTCDTSNGWDVCAND